VYRIEKTTRTVIYLKKAILIRSGSTKNYPIRNINDRRNAREVLHPEVQKTSVKPVPLWWAVRSGYRTPPAHQQKVSPKPALEAMLFGEKRELSGDIKELYQAAGISHVLVISGLHISLLALAVAGILRRLGFPMPVWVILSVIPAA